MTFILLGQQFIAKLESTRRDVQRTQYNNHYDYRVCAHNNNILHYIRVPAEVHREESNTISYVIWGIVSLLSKFVHYYYGGNNASTSRSSVSVSGAGTNIQRLPTEIKIKPGSNNKIYHRCSKKSMYMYRVSQICLLIEIFSRENWDFLMLFLFLIY